MSKKPTTQKPIKDKEYYRSLTIAGSMKDAPQSSVDFQLRNSPHISEPVKKGLGKIASTLIPSRLFEKSDAKQKLQEENALKVKAAKEEAAKSKELAKVKKEKERADLLEKNTKYKEEIAAKKAEVEAKEKARKEALKAKALGKKYAPKLEDIYLEDGFEEMANNRILHTIFEELDGESSDKELVEKSDEARRVLARMFGGLDEESQTDQQFQKSDKQLKLEQDRQKNPDPREKPKKKSVHANPEPLPNIHEELPVEVRQKPKNPEILAQNKKEVFDALFAHVAEKFGEDFNIIRASFESAWEKIMKLRRQAPEAGTEPALSAAWTGFGAGDQKNLPALNPSSRFVKFNNEEAMAMGGMCLGVKGLEFSIEDVNQEISPQERKIILDVVRTLRNNIVGPSPSNRPNTKEGKKVVAANARDYDGPSYV